MSGFDSAVATAAAKTMKQSIGAQIVSKTLDALNKTAPSKGRGKYRSGGDMAASYNFNKAVLSSVYSAKGAIAAMKA
ncbi:hypothetical protein FACS1894206_05560 [Deltaproteobacteria bacterium]|nr:hypothetical protein FACS1894206_05560 [Deltaproteobacteria bacterium]